MTILMRQGVTISGNNSNNKNRSVSWLMMWTTSLLRFLTTTSSSSSCSLGVGALTTTTRVVSPSFLPPPRIHHLPRARRSSSLYASHNDDANAYTKTVSSTWNLAGVRRETDRLISRCVKKMGKAQLRYERGLEVVEKLTSDNHDQQPTLAELEACPNVDAFRDELESLRERLRALRGVEEALKHHRSSSSNEAVVLPLDLASSLVELRVQDAAPVRPPPKKKNRPKPTSQPRLPYRRYHSVDGTEIRVGKQAADNDELSCNAAHRDADDWWMHAQGCPGSHVVIRTHAQQLPQEVRMDAAALAARRSKCAGARIKVTVTRCRHVSKPTNAKPGLVSIRGGNVQTVTVNMKEAEPRLRRLDETEVV